MDVEEARGDERARAGFSRGRTLAEEFHVAAEAAGLSAEAAARITRNAVRRLSLRSAAVRLQEAYAWATRAIRATPALLADLSEIAINRLRRLPAWPAISATIVSAAVPVPYSVISERGA